MTVGKRLVVPVVLCLLLIAAFASAASAAPRPVQPRVPDCTSWTTVVSNTTYYAGSASLYVAVQRQSPGWCDTFRSKTVLTSGYGNLATYLYRNGVTQTSTFTTCNSSCTYYSIDTGIALPANVQAYAVVSINGVPQATVNAGPIYQS